MTQRSRPNFKARATSEIDTTGSGQTTGEDVIGLYHDLADSVLWYDEDAVASVAGLTGEITAAQIANALADAGSELDDLATALGVGDSVGTTDLSWDSGTRTLSSSTGTDATITLVDSTNAGLMSSAQNDKLDGIEAGATADLTGAEVVSLINVELGDTGWQDEGYPVEDVSGNKTLATADAGKLLNLSDAGDQTVTVNDASLDADRRVLLRKMGSGTLDVVAGTGSPTLNSSGLAITGLPVGAQVIITGLGSGSYWVDPVLPASEFATSEQGARADTALQPSDVGSAAYLDAGSGEAGPDEVVTGDDPRLSDARTPLAHTHTLSDVTDAGTAAANDTGDFATEAQGALADTAVQPGDLATVATSGDAADLNSFAGLPVELMFALGDETTDATTGASKITLRAPYAFTLTEVRASVATAPTGSSGIVVDVNEDGASVLSTKLSVDPGERTSTTAAVSAVISDSAIADDAEITVDVDAVGADAPGAGLKVLLKGTRS